jgi:hypothetical protein
MPLVLNGTTGVQDNSGAFVQATAVASTSGTSIDFTSIPSWVKRITVVFNGVSTNGTSLVQVQSGSGSIENTGYTSSGALVASNAAVTSTGSITSGFVLPPLNGSGDARNGTLRISNLSGNIWVFEGCISSGGNSGFTSGVKSFSGVIDRVRITTVNGTDTFDAGSVNILYE